jgi:hypothetical protein
MVAFRLAIWGFAVVLGLLAAWLSSAEIIRPDVPYFAGGQAAFDASASERTRAGRAAEFGLIRGDLWADYATVLATGLVAELQGATVGEEPQVVESAQSAARRAAQLSPHDARAWLVLAAAASRLDRPNREVDGPLKMSNFTGPSEAALIPLRIRVATRSNVIEDEELQDLVVQDLRAVVTHQPGLIPDIVAAYRHASPPGKRFIETALDKLDPSLLRKIREAR